MAAMHNPAHPGEILRENMEELGLTVSALAEHLQITRANLSRIVNGKGGISAEMSIRLSEAFGTSADLWLKMQMNYDLWVASRNRKVKVAPIEKAA
jgi:addiction module HigA family antidote